MAKKTHKTLAQKLYNTNVFSNGALRDIPYKDLVIAKMEKDSNETTKFINNEP